MKYYKSKDGILFPTVETAVYPPWIDTNGFTVRQYVKEHPEEVIKLLELEEVEVEIK